MEDLLMNDFAAYAGVDANPMQKVQDLAKALTVGYGMDPSTQVGFGATRVQDLSRTLIEMTAKTQDAAFFNALSKGKATGPVVEWSSLIELGAAAAYTEGGLPPEYDEVLGRNFEQVKYIGAVGQVPYVAEITESVANNIDTITKAKVSAIIRAADVLSHFGDASKNSIEWNGYLAQFNARAKYPTQQTIDLRGKYIRPEDLNQAGTLIKESYGNGMNLKVWMANEAFQNYINGLIINKQWYVGASIQDIYVLAKKFSVGNGGGAIEEDIFLRHKGESYLDRLYPKLNSNNTAFATMHAKAPNQLSSTTATATPTTNNSTQLDVGYYDYCIVPANQYGAGPGFEIANVQVQANQQVSFTVADNGSPIPATKFDVYRKAHAGTTITDYRFLNSFAATATIFDAGADIPGTTYAFVYDWDFEQVLDFLQLLPLSKMPLATVSDSIRWLQKMYATPVLRNPNKMVVFKNVGKLAWS